MLSLRRFKAMLDGGPANGFRYHIQFVLKSNNNSSTDDRLFLQDAHILWPLPSGPAIEAGQFIPPFGLERFQPDYELDFVDRTEISRRLIVDGNLGDSFARDRGAQVGWDRLGWQFSGGIFDGAGANNPGRGNGPLGVGRASYGREGYQRRNWFWRAGLAGSLRRDADQSFSGQLPGLNKDLTSHFRGRDTRLDAFAQGSWGPLRSQGEYIRAWFNPASGAEIIAAGGYAQIVYLPTAGVTVGLRRECFNPDVRMQKAPSLSQWTVAATYDWPRVRLRFASDYSWIEGGTGPSSGWRVQAQYFIVKELTLRPRLPHINRSREF